MNEKTRKQKKIGVGLLVFGVVLAVLNIALKPSMNALTIGLAVITVMCWNIGLILVKEAEQKAEDTEDTKG